MFRGLRLRDASRGGLYKGCGEMVMWWRFSGVRVGWRVGLMAEREGHGGLSVCGGSR